MLKLSSCGFTVAVAILSEHTEPMRLFAFVCKPLAHLSLGDLQAFRDSLTTLAPSRQAQKLAAIKSLLAFARKISYLTFNVGAALQLPKSKNTLAERILRKTTDHV